MSQINQLVSQLTLEEKVSMVSGQNVWESMPVDRLNIPSFKMTDGPNGARGDAVSGATAACFPVGSALAATWNVDLIEQIGGALAAGWDFMTAGQTGCDVWNPLGPK